MTILLHKKPHEILEDKSFELLARTIARLQQKYDLNHNEILQLLREKQKPSIAIPISIFQNDALSSLEVVTKYLKEELKLRFCEIAFLLNRDDRTIWDAYNSSQQKMKEPLPVESSQYAIPLTVFQNRNLAVLETITTYLKEECNLRYCQIARLLNRDDRTIWTVYKRAKQKQP
jgi:hypothetical protein